MACEIPILLIISFICLRDNMNSISLINLFSVDPGAVGVSHGEKGLCYSFRKYRASCVRSKDLTWDFVWLLSFLSLSHTHRLTIYSWISFFYRNQPWLCKPISNPECHRLLHPHFSSVYSATAALSLVTVISPCVMDICRLVTHDWSFISKQAVNLSAESVERQARTVQTLIICSWTQFMSLLHHVCNASDITPCHLLKTLPAIHRVKLSCRARCQHVVKKHTKLT